MGLDETFSLFGDNLFAGFLVAMDWLYDCLLSVTVFRILYVILCSCRWHSRMFLKFKTSFKSGISYSKCEQCHAIIRIDSVSYDIHQVKDFCFLFCHEYFQMFCFNFQLAKTFFQCIRFWFDGCIYNIIDNGLFWSSRLECGITSNKIKTQPIPDDSIWYFEFVSSTRHFALATRLTYYVCLSVFRRFSFI